MRLDLDSEHVMVALIEEMIDANLDTINLLLARPDTTPWAGHADYLSALNREANALLARAHAPAPRWIDPSSETRSR